MNPADIRRMIKVYRTRGLGYRFAMRTTKAVRERSFEGELILRKLRGEDIFDEEVRMAAATVVVGKSKLPVLKEEEHLAGALVEQEILRLATMTKQADQANGEVTQQ